MPDGRTHYNNWTISWVWIVVLVILVTAFQYYFVAIGIAFGYFLGRWIDPDLDQLALTNAESRMMHEIPMLGMLFVASWFPYAYLARLVGGHRSFWTHFPVVSTAIRIIYMAVVSFIMLFTLYSVVHVLSVMVDVSDIISLIPFNDIQSIVKSEYALMVYYGAFTGLSIADFIHWFADVKSKHKE